MTTDVYPGTFNPITRGHADLIERVAKIFDRVIVAVAIGRHKEPEIQLDERVSLANMVVEHLGNVDFKGFSGLIVDFAAQHEARIIIKGLRTVDDFDNELRMAHTNRSRDSGLETLFVPTAQEHSHISSTIIRQMARYGADISPYVHPEVERYVVARFGNPTPA